MHVLCSLTLDSRCCLLTVALAWTSGWAAPSFSSSFPPSLPFPLSSFSSSSLPALSSTSAAVDRTLRRSRPSAAPARAAADSSTDRGELAVADEEDEEERAEPSREWRAPYAEIAPVLHVSDANDEQEEVESEKAQMMEPAWLRAGAGVAGAGVDKDEE